MSSFLNKCVYTSYAPVPAWISIMLLSALNSTFFVEVMSAIAVCVLKTRHRWMMGTKLHKLHLVIQAALLWRWTWSTRVQKSDNLWCLLMCRPLWWDRSSTRSEATMSYTVIKTGTRHHISGTEKNAVTMSVMWSTYKSAGYNSLQRYISSCVNRLRGWLNCTRLINAGSLKYSSTLSWLHLRGNRSFKCLNVFRSGADVCSRLPRWFIGTPGFAAPLCPHGKAKNWIFFSPENKYSKVWSANLSKPSCDCDWRGHFPKKQPPPSPLAKLPVYTLSTFCYFIVKNEP